MRTFRKIVGRTLLVLLLAFLIVPFLIPVNTSGTLTNVEAAGAQATFAQLAGLQVHTEEIISSNKCKCEQPLIVLMHGFGASTFSWREVIEPLSAFGDVIAYDRPGFGFTQRPTEWGQVNPYGFEGNFLLLDSIIEKYATSNQVILVGHSAGGQLAAEYARLNPNKVSGLVLVDPAILTTGQSPSWLNWILNIPQVDRIGPLLVKSISESGNDLLRQSFYDPESVTQEVFEGYNKVLKVKEWERAFWNFTKAPRDNDLAANLESVTQPILLITGERDTVVPTSDTVKLADIFPNSSLEIIKKSAHLPQEEQPQDFMTAIENHWEELVS